ncbi:MAG: 4Fe-4S binding protein [Caulobacteraceae bacterium]|nr:4Fe-4S binding protein [Caulobacteraceae bacterium]
MKTVNFEIGVIDENCTGCYLCERICPTAAIEMVGPKSSALAVVDNSKCVACFRCIDICEDDALLSHERKAPVKFGIDPASVDQVALGELLLKADLDPDAVGCVCSTTSNKEIAAAVIAGARTLEEVSLRSGVQSGCLMYCFAPIHRLVTTHWGEMPESSTKNKWYGTSQTLMDVAPEVAQGARDFFVEEEQAAFIEVLRNKIAAYGVKIEALQSGLPPDGE